MKTWLLAILLFLGSFAQAIGAPTDVLYSFDITRFGAVPNDGADDTLAIQRCVTAALAETPCEIFIPRGTYDVANASTGSTQGIIVIPDTATNITIRGSNSIFKFMAAGVGEAAVRIFGSRCTVYDLTIDMNSTVSDPLLQNSGFEINGGDSNTLRNCHCINGTKPYTTFHDAGNITYTHSTRQVTKSGGASWPTWAAGDELYINGVRYPVQTRNSNTVLTLTTSSNPGVDVSSTNDYLLEGEYLNVNQGEECFVVVNGDYNKFENCTATDAAWQSFRFSGDFNSCIGCVSLNGRGNGIRVLRGQALYIERFVYISTIGSGRCGILFDAGSSTDSSPEDVSDIRTNYAFIKDSYLYADSDGRGDVNSGGGDGSRDGAGQALKLGSVDYAHIQGCVIVGGTAANNVALRLEDCIDKVVIEHCPRISPGILFTPTGASVAQGVPSGYTNSGGNTSWTMAPQGVVAGKSVYVSGSGVPALDGEQIVQSTTGSTIVTDRPYLAGSMSSNVYLRSGVDQVYIKDVNIDSTYVTGGSYIFPDASARIFDMEDVNITIPTSGAAKCAIIDWAPTTDNGFERLRIVNCRGLVNNTFITKFVRVRDQGTLETQRLTITGSPGSGNFQATYNGATTSNIAYNASNTTCRTALRTLPGLEDVLVTKDTTDPSNPFYTVTFHGCAAPTQITCTDTFNTGDITGSTTAEAVLPLVFIKPNKIIAYDNSYINLNTGTTEFIDIQSSGDGGVAFKSRELLFNTDGEDRNTFLGTFAPTSEYPEVTWVAGNRIKNSSVDPGKAFQWLCAAGGAPGTWWAHPVRPPQTISVKTAQTPVTGASEETLYTYSIPANTQYSDGDMLELTASLTFEADASNKRVYVKYGSGPTTIYDSTSTAHNGGSLIIRLVMIRRSNILVKYHYTVTATGSGTPIASSSASASLTTDTGAAQALSITADGDDADDIVLEFANLRFTPATVP